MTSEASQHPDEPQAGAADGAVPDGAVPDGAVPDGAVPQESPIALGLDWLRAGRRTVIALLVEVEGSAALAPGAFMLIGEDGAIEGSVTGGCVEGDVVRRAQQILATNGPAQLATYGISDELAGSVGLMCGGTAHILIHELRGASAQAATRVFEAVQQGRAAALVTVLDGDQAGATISVVDGVAAGSLGVTELLDHNIARDAAGLLHQGITGIRKYGSDGTVLGSELRVHVASYAEPPKMIIFGAIDFSAALAPIARELGYEVMIVDARAPFARSARFRRAAEVIVDWPDRAMAGRRLGPRDAVLVFTHDPKFDQPAILAALATDAGYIGVLGSRRTAAQRELRLREAGVTDEMLARLSAPCGLDIAARTPGETAVSILAEIVSQRSGRSGERLRTTSGSIRGLEAVGAR